MLQDTYADRSGAFAELNSEERSELREWQIAARAIGVDAVEDLSSRPWPYPMAGSIIGVFRANGKAASWLVIGQSGTWAVACCDDGSVSPACHSLSDALAVIYPMA
jgi:hypothetical protein